MNLKETGCKDGDWIQVPQDGVQSRALVNTVMDLGFLKIQRIAFSAERLSASQDGHRFNISKLLGESLLLDRAY
jgi:hypothetical protein